MTLALRPSLNQKQAECLKEIHPLQANLEEAAKKLETLKNKVEEIRQTFGKNPEPASESVLQHVLQEHELAKITEQTAQLEFSQKVTEYFWVLKGSKDRLARELYPNNSVEQEAFIEEIDAALVFALESEPTSSEKRSAPEEQIMEDQSSKKARIRNPLISKEL